MCGIYYGIIKILGKYWFFGPSTNQEIDLGEEYEKIIGTQDTSVNDGAIVDSVIIPPQDGLLMLKTSQTIKEVSFKNGDFLRFYYDF